MNFSQRLTQSTSLVEARLRDLLAAAVAESTPESQRLQNAVHDAAASGGKRLRPFLVIECAGLFGVPKEDCLNAAAALECVHCYSLVHDDLPCMDNDELRRGQPSIWKAYDEWTAVLAGDALLTLAFEILAREDTHPKPETRLALIATLARASGVAGMAQGQAMDLAASKRDEPTTLTLSHVKKLQALKTGALIKAACLFGGLLGAADKLAMASLENYGEALGLAFQISDDLLDVEGNTEQLGKKTGKDTDAGKATFVGLLSVEGARAELKTAREAANIALNDFGSEADVLLEVANFVAKRDH